MSKRAKQLICVALAATLVTLASSSSANAQYPVVVNTVTPAVVGYSAEPAGLFGLRTRYRPVVAPVATPVAVTPVAVAPVAVKPVTVVPSPAPVVRYAAPPVVQTYYTPAPAVAPVTYVSW